PGADPVARSPREAGFTLHWSAGRLKVFCSLGPGLFSRDLSRTFPFLNNGLDKRDEPEAKGIPIGFNAKSDVPDGSIAFVGARIITSAGDQVIENGTLVIENNRIAAIGPSSSVEIPAGARRIDASGKTIMPGIVDVHGHVGGEGDGILAQNYWPFAANLAFGVTTVHDPSNDSATVFTNAELIRPRQNVGPRLYSTGPMLH